MAAADLWTRFCETRLANSTLGMTLDVSRMRFSPEQLAGLRAPMTRALDAMAKLEAGAIANIDEQRMVGHYWLRNPALAEGVGFRQAIEAELIGIQRFVSDVHSGKIAGADGRFQRVLHIGIGGSALGPQFVAQALGGSHDRLSVTFVDNTDPDGIDQELAQHAGLLGTTLVVVVSKSGGTPETRNGMLEAQAAYRRAGLDFARHAVAVTQAGSRLDQLAEAEGWLSRRPMWDWVGGRTSVMSNVGLLPAALQGIDIQGFLDGAAEMDRWTRLGDPDQNPAALMAMMWHIVGDGRGAKDLVVLPYKDRLALFSRYLQQLVMESLGKELDRSGRKVHQGLAVYGNKGSTDQHAYIQQLRDGLANFFVTFIAVLRDREGDSIEVEPGITSGDYLQGFLLGTRQALYDSQRDSMTIGLRSVTPQSVGALIALFERAVGLYAELIDVNAYHQPGVEAGKKAAAVVLAVQEKAVAWLRRQSTAKTAGDTARGIGVDDVETIYQLFSRLAANPSSGITAQPADSPQHEQFQAVR